jgi:hypothetical protein
MGSFILSQSGNIEKPEQSYAGSANSPKGVAPGIYTLFKESVRLFTLTGSSSVLMHFSSSLLLVL